MNADLLAMLSGGGLGGMPGGAGGRNPAEESGTELLRFKAGRMKAELQQVRSFGSLGGNLLWLFDVVLWHLFALLLGVMFPREWGSSKGRHLGESNRLLSIYEFIFGQGSCSTSEVPLGGYAKAFILTEVFQAWDGTIKDERDLCSQNCLVLGASEINMSRQNVSIHRDRSTRRRPGVGG